MFKVYSITTFAELITCIRSSKNLSHFTSILENYREKYENDGRWKYGRPPVGNANYAWLQHILWKLKPGGQAGVVLANGSMSSNTSGEDQIRKALERDKFMTPEEAKNFGLIDEVVEKRS